VLLISKFSDCTIASVKCATFCAAVMGRIFISDHFLLSVQQWNHILFALRGCL